MSKAPTAAERRLMDRIASLCCIACERDGHEGTPAGLHHIRQGYGRGQRAPHTHVLPLCARHHQTGGYGVAFHAGPRAWVERYGSERELLAEVWERVGFTPGLSQREGEEA